MRISLIPLTQLILSFYFTICLAFSSESLAPIATRLSTSMKTSLSASMLPSEEDPQTVLSSDITTPKISYRNAKLEDVSAISGLLNCVFEDDGGQEQDDEDDTTTSDNTDDDNNTFMWGSLAEESSEPQLSPEQQLELIEEKLSKRMVDAKKEDSLPHLFLVATIPWSSEEGSTNEQEVDRIIGFLEMGTLPPPIPNSPIGKVELPYIGNVAVSNDARRRRVGSTLVRLASKIAAKWCAPASETPFPPFLFLSVERDNEDALKFYDQLGFEELNAAKKSIEKIYLAQELE